jgi:hypothetical protein
MLPFVLVYGLSAFFFNHPGGAAAITVLPRPTNRIEADATALAAMVATALGVPADGVTDARLEGEWTFEFETDGMRRRLALPIDDAPPTLRHVPSTTARTERVPASVFASLNDAALAAARRALANAGLPDADLRRTGAPTLRYATAEHTTSVSLDRGQATQRSAAAFDLARLLMRLHTAHGHGDHWARFAWATVVDLMAASMVLWAGSGLVMWWQRRSHRRAGLLVLVVSVTSAVTIAVSMAGLFRR